ncbi:MAG: carboxypeptidase regulatory-like domain-containing protein, partial [Saprospiraceae bacterium]|nr:carboxypeptidase regulatory-like domain-containing protein [Saprospiraceae bacterium]
KPSSPGVVMMNFVLGDTLTLDKRYDISIESVGPYWLKKQRIQYWQNIDFHYEDYQLDAATYTFKSLKAKYEQDEPVRLSIQATDANGQPLPDVQYKLVLLTKFIHRFDADSVAIADTLWRHQEMLPGDEDYVITVPDSIWPRAKLDVQAKVWFTTTSGELQERSATFTYGDYPQKVAITVEKGRIFFKKTPQAKDLPDSLRISVHLSTGKKNEWKATLPFSIPVQSEATSHYVYWGKEDHLNYASLGLGSVPHGVSIQCARSGDSVLFRVFNPHRLNVHWQVNKAEQYIAEGAQADSTWVMTYTDRQGEDYTLGLLFTWAGNPQSVTKKCVFIQDNLTIKVTQPEQVQPGSVMDVQIQTIDKDKQPVGQVNLTAGAYNAQFGDNNKPYRAPKLAYKPSEQPRHYYDLKTSDFNKRAWRTPMSREWYKRLRLDQHLYYRLRYALPEKKANGKPIRFGLWTEVLPLTGEGAALQPDAIQDRNLMDSTTRQFLNQAYSMDQAPQFALWIFRNGREEPIDLLYVNNDLVYCAANTDAPPYSFYHRLYGNNIMARTRNGLYTIYNIYGVNTNEKIEIALHLPDTMPVDCKSCPIMLDSSNTNSTVSFQFVQMPDTLNNSEKQMLRERMLIVNNPHPLPSYVWENAYSIHQLKSSQYSDQIVGPFSRAATIKQYQVGGFNTAFQLEQNGGFRYVVSRNRERLYETRWPWNNVRLPLSNNKPKPGWAALGGQHIRAKTPIKPALYFNWNSQKAPGKGSLSWKISSPSPTIRAISFQQKGRINLISPDTKSIHGIEPGQCTLRFYTATDSIADYTFWVKGDTLIYKNFSALSFRQVLPAERADSVNKPNTIRIDPANYSQNSSNFYYYHYDGDGVDFGKTILTGTITDSPGEGLIGASVKVSRNNVLIGGLVTDIDGQFRMNISPGYYDVEVHYTGYASVRMTNVHVLEGKLNIVDIMLSDATVLNEVFITAYKIPLIEQDRTESGQTLTSDEIQNLPTRNTAAIVATTTGVTDDIQVKGSRANSTDYYIDGVQVSSELTGLEALDLRTEFRDHAWWQPNLMTDDQGQAHFRVKVPDDITAWNTFVLGMDAHGRGGVNERKLKSFKMLTAQVFVPRFAVAGDRFELSGLCTNLRRDSVRVLTAFRQNGELLKENNTSFGTGLSEFTTVQIPETTDSVLFSYELRSTEGSDGEERSIGVLPKGFIQKEGEFFLIDKDTTFQYQPLPGVDSVLVQMYNDPFNIIIEDIKYLRNYPYGCNEQTSSRLKALILLKKIAARHSILHWNDADEQSVRQCVVRLRNNQNADGSWGWWGGNQQNAWMTTYVLRALHEAKLAGYHTADALDRGLTWLRHQLPVLNYDQQIDALIALREMNVNMDCNPWLKDLKAKGEIYVKDNLMFLKMKQLCGDTVSREQVLSFLNYQPYGGIICLSGSRRHHYDYWYHRAEMNTLMVFDIAEKAGWDDITAGIRKGWLKNRSVRYYRNTIETAMILERMERSGDVLNEIKETHLKIGGQDIRPGQRTVIRVRPNEPLQVEKSDSNIWLGSIWQEFYNPDPAPKAEPFVVSTKMRDAKGHEITRLKRGEAAYLVVTVETKSTSQYVMIEAPIPAGCSYGPKVQTQYWWGLESQREYFRDRVAIFCENLWSGIHEFQIALEPRFSGTFTLNPAHAEEMYFPDKNGNNSLKKVEIER